jgi:hypothetical protein
MFIICTAHCTLHAATPVNAQTMSNNSYIIKMQGFNTISGVTTGQDYNLRSTVGGNSPVVSEGVNFKVKAGFENLVSTSPFSILLSSSLVDFGIFSPTDPIIRTVNLNARSLTTYGYSVLVFENESLAIASTSGKTFIPDTTCDFGACGTENAAEWRNALTYGFGYRCDNVIGTDCDSSFAKANFYKHFPDIANNDDPISIMAGVGSSNKETRISYKVNISGTQTQGVYNNIVTYIGVPNY